MSLSAGIPWASLWVFLMMCLSHTYGWLSFWLPVTQLPPSSHNISYVARHLISVRDKPRCQKDRSNRATVVLQSPSDGFPVDFPLNSNKHARHRGGEKKKKNRKPSPQVMKLGVSLSLPNKRTSPVLGSPQPAPAPFPIHVHLRDLDRLPHERSRAGPSTCLATPSQGRTRQPPELSMTLDHGEK